MFGLHSSWWIHLAIVGSAMVLTPAGAAENLPQLDTAGVTADELGFEEIVFVKRKPYSSDHYYTDINNGTSPDRFLADNGVYIYNLVTRQERPVVTAAQLPGGKGFIGKITAAGPGP